MIAFIIWALVACIFIIIGISCLFAKNATGFWANADVFEVNDVKKYNRAMAKLWCSFGVIMILIGIPLLDETNTALVMLSVFGIIIEIIALMIIYVLVIEKKYKK